MTSIIEQLNADSAISQRLKLKGEIEFENHPNTLSDGDEKVASRLQNISLTTSDRFFINSFIASATQKIIVPKNVDQIVVYHKQNNEKIANLIVEYKTAHKLILANIHADLHPMNLDKDVINRQTVPSKEAMAERFEYHSERLVAAAICQCFSYMVDCGLMYEYVCTGEAFIFLQIPENPDTVYYSLFIPNTDVEKTTE